MQTLISGLIIIAALIYVAKRWLPTRIKQRCMQLLGKPVPVSPAAGACSACSSCGNCGSDSTALVKKVHVIHSR